MTLILINYTQYFNDKDLTIDNSNSVKCD